MPLPLQLQVASRCSPGVRLDLRDSIPTARQPGTLSCGRLRQTRQEARRHGVLTLASVFLHADVQQVQVQVQVIRPTTRPRHRAALKADAGARDKLPRTCNPSRVLLCCARDNPKTEIMSGRFDIDSTSISYLSVTSFFFSYRKVALRYFHDGCHTVTGSH